MRSFIERQILNKLPWPIRLTVKALILLTFLVWGIFWLLWKGWQGYLRWRTRHQPVKRLEGAQEARKRLTRTIKRRVMVRDGHTCVECGHGRHDGRKVAVDHHLPVADFPELVAETWNLKTMCGESEPGNGDGGCNGAKSDEIPATVIDWDARPPREICSTAEFIAKGRDIAKLAA